MKYYNIAVPKTATESLQLSMKEAGLDIFITMKVSSCLDYIPAASHKIITGHFHYGIHKVIAPRGNYKYFSAVREPLERIVSDYGYQCRHDDEYKNLYSLEEFIKIAPANLMSIQMFGFGVKDIEEIQQMMKSEYAIIGCIEYIQEYFNEIEKLLDVKLEMKKQNIALSEIKFQFSEEFILEFKEKNLLDYQLYEIIKKNKVLTFP